MILWGEEEMQLNLVTGKNLVYDQVSEPSRDGTGKNCRIKIKVFEVNIIIPSSC